LDLSKILLKPNHFETQYGIWVKLFSKLSGVPFSI
jgi:hypothetical protein